MSREHDKGGIVIEVAAADHLMRVEAERDALRSAILAIPRHEQIDDCIAGLWCDACDTGEWPCPVEGARLLAEGTP